MNAGALPGRPTPAIACETLQILRERCAPEFWTLDANPCLPDHHITTLVEWADDLEAADPTAAFDIEVLEAVLPALNAALLASYSFSGEPARDPSLRGRQVDLVLTDRGGAVLVEMSRACACLLAVFFHGARRHRAGGDRQRQPAGHDERHFRRDRPPDLGRLRNPTTTAGDPAAAGSATRPPSPWRWRALFTRYG